MLVKTSELTGAALDYIVQQIEQPSELIYQNGKSPYKPSTNWAQGGPIIERELIGVDTKPCVRAEKGDGEWFAFMDQEGKDCLTFDGPTPLIAAMRCYVASKLGEEIEIQEGLV